MRVKNPMGERRGITRYGPLVRFQSEQQISGNKKPRFLGGA